MEHAFLYPEIIEALESRTLSATTLIGVLTWISIQIGVTESEAFFMFSVDVMNYLKGVV